MAPTPAGARTAPVSSGVPAEDARAAERRSLNRRRATEGVFLGAATAGIATGIVVGVVVGLATAPLWGIVGAAAAAVAGGFGAARWIGGAGTGTVLRASGALRLDAGAEARLANVVEALCLSNGIREPELYVVEDRAVNSFAVASRGRTALAFTRGALDALDRMELEALVAHELAHIALGDAERRGVFSALAAGLAVVLPAASRRVVSLLGPEPEAEWDADRAAITMTRYPPALAGVLQRAQQAPAGPALASRKGRILDQLWAVPALRASAAGSGAFAGAISVPDRIELLSDI